MTQQRTLLEDVPDLRAICVLLRGFGYSYPEIGAFLGIGIRSVRHELEVFNRLNIPDLLDSANKQSRSLRAMYLLGLSDGGVAPDELPDFVDALFNRALMVRSKMNRAAR